MIFSFGAVIAPTHNHNPVSWAKKPRPPTDDDGPITMPSSTEAVPRIADCSVKDKAISSSAIGPYDLGNLVKARLLRRKRPGNRLRHTFVFAFIICILAMLRR